MGGFGINFEGELKTPEESRDISMSSEVESILCELFKEDYEGVERKEDEETTDFESIDTQKEQNDLFADDYLELDKDIAESEGSDDAENLEYDENGTRELTDDEKQMLKDNLGWSDKKINDNCRIDKDGVVHYKTDCQDKEGTVSECGVPYERKVIEYKGIKIEGVFPVFDSVFDTELDESDYQSSSSKQFNECNKKLKETINNDPELKEQFTDEQIEDIENGRTPRGYTWHHTEEPGKMQLVKTEDHDRRIGGAAHTGGNSIWGNKSMDRSTDEEQKGERF